MKHSKLVFLQAADAARFCQAKISQAEFVKTSKPVFCQAAEAATIRHAKIHQDESVTTSRLIFCQATEPHHVCGEHRAVICRTPFKFAVPLFLVQTLHLDKLPPAEPPLEPPPWYLHLNITRVIASQPSIEFLLLCNHYSLIYRSYGAPSILKSDAYLMFRMINPIKYQSIFLESSTASSNGIPCSHNKVLAAITNESVFQEPIHGQDFPVQSCPRATKILVCQIDLFPITLTDRFPKPPPSSSIIKRCF